MTAPAILTPSRSLAQAVYYLGWVAMVFVESVLWSELGVVLGLVAFTLGGAGWGLWQAAHTVPHEPLRGPVLRLTRRLLNQGGWCRLVGAVLVGGPPGVAAASASNAWADTGRLIRLSSVFYAVIWMTFHLVRPQGGLPMRLWPNLFV